MRPENRNILQIIIGKTGLHSDLTNVYNSICCFYSLIAECFTIEIIFLVLSQISATFAFAWLDNAVIKQRFVTVVSCQLD